jgi:hypothetical protein
MVKNLSLSDFSYLLPGSWFSVIQSHGKVLTFDHIVAATEIFSLLSLVF